MSCNHAALFFLVGLAGAAAAEPPCVSGLQPGQRPGPYAAIVAVGPNRGQLHCFVCETADRPAAIIFARKFSGARWLPWVSGVGLIALVWFIGWTGYWLVWDQPAQQVAVGSMRLLDTLPIFGEPLGRLFVADRMVPSLLFFVVFFLHMLLPLGIAVGLALHLVRVSRVRLFPRWPVMAALTAGLGVSSTSFWCRRCTEQSRSPRWMQLPCPSANT